MGPTWNEKLQKKLIQQFGNKKGLALSKKYANAFPPVYTSDCPVEVAVSDIDYMELLNADEPLAVCLHLTTPPTEYPLHLRLFQWQKPIPLSDILPMLENMGLRTYNENPYNITLPNNQRIYISDFAVVYNKANIDIANINALFQDAFIHIYSGLAENDGFNQLLLGASLSWREIMILRTFAKYLRQIGFRFSQAYIENTLVNQAEITKDLISLFLLLHDPSKQAKSKNQAKQLEQAILTALESVSSLDEDRIIRRMLDLIKAVMRTNYFQLDNSGQPKDYLSIKLSSRTIPEIPLPPLV